MIMDVVGMAMMGGMVFGAAYGAGQSGKIEDNLKKQIGDIENQTQTLQDNLDAIAKAEAQQTQEALEDTITVANNIINIKAASKADTDSYLLQARTTSIYGIVFVALVCLYLLAKLLLPSWEDFKKL
jgi:hypothetical protein